LLIAAWMALYNPNLPWDIGFRLSFTSSLVLILFVVPLSDSFGLLVTSRLSAVVAHLASPPTSLYLFGCLSAVSPLANLPILPSQPAVVLLWGAYGWASWRWEK
jgi:hypothetical protein